MENALLFDCFTQCSVDPTFQLYQEDAESWKDKMPPIVDMIIVAEENMAVGLLYWFYTRGNNDIR